MPDAYIEKIILSFMEEPFYLYAIIGYIGLFFGSFLNVLIYRLPIMMDKEFVDNVQSVCAADGVKVPPTIKKFLNKFPGVFNLFLPRSACPHCGHKIKWYENLPIISWVLLRGKCSKCQTKISMRYPIIEILTGLIWVLCFKIFALDVFSEGNLIIPLIHFLLVALSLTFLLAMSLIDYEHLVLPDSLTFGVLFMGLFFNIYTAESTLFVSPLESVLGAIIGYLSIWLFISIYETVKGIDMAMGRGDFKLFAASGAWFGIYSLPYVVFYSAFFGMFLIGFIHLLSNRSVSLLKEKLYLLELEISDWKDRKISSLLLSSDFESILSILENQPSTVSNKNKIKTVLSYKDLSEKVNLKTRQFPFGPAIALTIALLFFFQDSLINLTFLNYYH